MRWLALLVASCLVGGCKSSAPVNASCLPNAEVIELVRSLRVQQTWMLLDAAYVESLTGAQLSRGMATVERVPLSNACRCCITVLFDEAGRTREFIIIRELVSLSEARDFARELVSALNLPTPDVSAPGEDVALYRWNIPGHVGEQLGLDISIAGEKPIVRAAIVVFGRRR